MFKRRKPMLDQFIPDDLMPGDDAGDGTAAPRYKNVDEGDGIYALAEEGGVTGTIIGTDAADSFDAVGAGQGDGRSVLDAGPGADNFFIFDCGPNIEALGGSGADTFILGGCPVTVSLGRDSDPDSVTLYPMVRGDYVPEPVMIRDFHVGEDTLTIAARPEDLTTRIDAGGTWIDHQGRPLAYLAGVDDFAL